MCSLQCPQFLMSNFWHSRDNDKYLPSVFEVIGKFYKIFLNAAARLVHRGGNSEIIQVYYQQTESGCQSQGWEHHP